MRTGPLIGTALVAAALSVAAPSAEAVTFRFDSPGLVPDSFAGCFNGDRCGGTLSFERSGIGVTVSAFGWANAVIQDLNPSRGGLGAVWELAPPRRPGFWDFGDEVNYGQGLRLAFDQDVSLRRARFRNEDHGGSFDASAGFLFSTDGESWDWMTLNRLVSFDGPVSSTFYFAHGGQDHGEDFYLARVRVDPFDNDEPEPIPEPGTVTLLGAGLLSFAARARRRARR